MERVVKLCDIDKGLPKSRLWPELVIRECASIHPKAVAARLAAIADISLLTTTEQVDELAIVLTAGVPFPPNAEVDAVQIAHVAVHAVEYLLTWNCAHLANPNMRKRVEATCADTFGRRKRKLAGSISGHPADLKRVPRACRKHPRPKLARFRRPTPLWPDP